MSMQSLFSYAFVSFFHTRSLFVYSLLRAIYLHLLNNDFAKKLLACSLSLVRLYLMRYAIAVRLSLAKFNILQISSNPFLSINWVCTNSMGNFRSLNLSLQYVWYRVFIHPPDILDISFFLINNKFYEFLTCSWWDLFLVISPL